MADLYEQWIEKVEGRKAFFYRDSEGRLRYAGGPGSGGGGSTGGGGGSTAVDLSHDPEDASYYGQAIADIVQDPRNITPEEYRNPTLKKIRDRLFDAADGDESLWQYAKEVAQTFASEAGRIIEGPGEHTTRFQEVRL